MAYATCIRMFFNHLAMNTSFDETHFPADIINHSKHHSLCHVRICLLFIVANCQNDLPNGYRCDLDCSIAMTVATNLYSLNSIKNRSSHLTQYFNTLFICLQLSTRLTELSTCFHDSICIPLFLW